MAEARKLRTRVVQHRRIVRDGESLKKQEHMARIRLAEKLQMCFIAASAESGVESVLLFRERDVGERFKFAEKNKTECDFD